VWCKTSRCDVLIISDERVFDLEAQRRHVNVANKALFYAARLLGQFTSKGDDESYDDLPQIVVLVRLEGRILLPGKQSILSVGTMHWKGEEAVEATDRIVLVLAELEKARRLYTDNPKGVLGDETLSWLYLLSDGYKDPEKVSEIVSSFPTIEEFAERYGIAIGDPDLESKYEKYYESVLEYNTMRNEALNAGRAEGLEQGRAEGLELGRAEGLELGRAEGRTEGRAEGRAEMAERLRGLGVAEELIQQALRATETE
jgi:hypothetical protein